MVTKHQVYSFFRHKHPGNSIAAIVFGCALFLFGADWVKSLGSAAVTRYAAAVPDSKSQAIREAELAKLTPKDRPWMADGSALATVANWTFTVSKAAAEGLNYALYSDPMFASPGFGIPPTQVVVERDGTNKTPPAGSLSDPSRWLKEYNDDAINKAASSPGYGGKTGERYLEGQQQTTDEKPVNTAQPGRDWRDLGPPRPGRRTVIPDQQPANPRQRFVSPVRDEDLKDDTGSGGLKEGGGAAKGKIRIENGPCAGMVVDADKPLPAKCRR